METDLNNLMKRIIPVLLFMIPSVITLNSCVTSAYQWKDYSEEDAKFFNFSPGDTVLDYGGKNLFFDNYIFTSDSTLHFYLTCNDSETKATQNIIDKYSKKYFQNNFKSSISLTKASNDIILLNSNSVDKILLTKINLSYNKIDTLLNEIKRIIKRKGTIIISVSTSQGHNAKKYPNEESITGFFEKKGFKILKKKTNTVTGKSGGYTILILENPAL